MSGVDKFSFALKKGFNTLGQPSEIFGNPARDLHASVCYFNFEKTSGNNVKIGSYGFKVVRENEIAAERAIYEAKGTSPASLEILRQTEAAFALVREGGMPLADANAHLKAKTEDFFQTYIADQTITQTYNPTFRQFISEKPENPADEFNYRRALQEVDKKIGTDVEISHENIRRTWGLD